MHYKEKYLFFSRYVKTLITEYDYFKLTFLRRNKNSKLFYTYVNKKLNRVDTSIKLKNALNGSYLSDTEACKVFAEYFYSTFTKSDGVLQPFEELCGLEIDDICFDISKLNKYLKKLPAKLSCGPDGIPSVFLKKLHSSLSLSLSLLFQKSYNSGKLPSEWRNALMLIWFPFIKARAKDQNVVIIALLV